MRGAAGTGKTATLHEIDRGLRDAGREIVAVAPTRSAVEELRKVGFQDAMTISRLLDANTEQPSLLGKVLVVDEAGMVSGRQMEGLLKLAEREGARILFSGDTRQIQSVEASDALRILERESQMKSVSLTGVQRQTQAEYRDAIQTLRQAPEQGFQKLEQLGAIREVPYLERPQAVASAYRELTTDPNRKVLVVAGTHEEIGRITHAIREGMKQSGDLDLERFSSAIRLCNGLKRRRRTCRIISKVRFCCSTARLTGSLETMRLLLSVQTGRISSPEI